MPTQLFITQEEPTHCYVSGEPLQERKVHLGLKTHQLLVTILYAPQSNIYYLPLFFLMEIRRDLELPATALQSFVINDEAIETFLATPDGKAPFAEVVQESQRPKATRAEAKAVPPSAETWQLSGKPGGWVEDLGSGKPGLSYFYAVTDARGFIRNTAPLTGEGVSEEMLEFLYTAMAHPAQMDDGSKPARPKTLVVHDESLVAPLEQALGGFGIEIVFGFTPLADEALTALSDYMGEPTKPYLSHFSEGEVKAFFKAAGEFYKATPWQRFAPRKFLAFKLDDAPWHYANIMGQGGQEFGIAMFTDWLQVYPLHAQYARAIRANDRSG